MVCLRPYLRLASVLFVTAVMPLVSQAALINANVGTDTATVWSGYVDWTVPVSPSNITLDAGPNWEVSVVEVPVGGGFGVIVISARHLVAPHGPGPAGTFLFGTFGPIFPSSNSGPVTDTEPHADAAGHQDSFRAQMNALNATTSRIQIDLSHTDDIPEPATAALMALGVVCLGISRRIHSRKI
jgi:hypothetical protein